MDESVLPSLLSRKLIPHRCLIDDNELGNGMYPVAQSEIRSLVRQILDKQTNSRETRVQACSELRKVIGSLHNINELSYDWRGLASELSEVVAARLGSSEVKKAATAALAALGGLLQHDVLEFFTTVRQSYERVPARGEESRALFVGALTGALQGLAARRVQLHGETLASMNKVCTSLLDENSSASVLSSLLELQVVAATFAPAAFIPFFPDMVDVTIGWFVGVESGENVTEKCAQTLLALDGFWLEHIDLLTRFCNDFVEDVRVYLNDARTENNDEGTRKATAVVKGIQLLFKIASRLPPNPASEYIQLCVKNVVFQVCELCVDGSLLLSSLGEAVALLYSAFLHVFSDALPFIALSQTEVENEEKLHMARIALDAATQSNWTSTQLTLAALQFLQKLVSSSSEAVSVPLCAWLCAGGGSGHSTWGLTPPLDGLRLRQTGAGGSRAVTTAFSALLAVLLNPAGGLPVLQQAYSAVSGMMKESLAALCDERTPESTGRDHATRIITLLSSLKQLIIIKNSIIVMMGITPSLFHLLVTECRLVDFTLIQSHPNVHVALLHTAQQHCAAHDYFVPTSAWVTTKEGTPSSVIGTSVTALHSQTQLMIITELLSMTEFNNEHGRRVLHNWLLGITDRLSPETLHRLAVRPAWKHLAVALSAALPLAPSSRLASLLGLLEREQKESRAVAESRALQKAIAECTTSSRRTALWQLMRPEAIPASLRTRPMVTKALEQLQQQQNPNQNVLALGLLPALSLSPFATPLPSLAFSPQHFDELCAFLLRGRPPIESLPTPDSTETRASNEDWLWGGGGSLALPAAIGEGAKGISEEWRRRISLAANFIVENRLKTPLGKPQQTLQAFLLEIQRLAKAAVGGSSAESNGNGVRPSSSLSRIEEWFRVRCLLELLDQLDRLLFNAAYGCMQPIATVSQASRQFFMANVAVCAEWFARVLPSAMAASFHAGAYAQTIRFGSVALAELEKRRENLEESLKNKAPLLTLIVLGWLARAMVELSAEPSVVGLVSWASSRYTVTDNGVVADFDQWDWLRAARLAAASRFEEALNALEKVLARSPQEAVANTVQALMIRCVSRLRYPGYFKRLAFNDKDMERCRQLTSFTKVESAPETKAPSWDLLDHFEIRECSLLQTISRRQVSEMLSRTSAEGALVLQFDDDGTAVSAASALSRIQASLHAKMDSARGEQRQADSMQRIRSLLLEGGEVVALSSADGGARLCLGRQMAEWAARLGCSPSSAQHFQLAKLARKTRNSATMRLHLDRTDLNGHVFSALQADIQRLKMERETLEPSLWQMEKLTAVPQLAGLFDVHTQFQMEEALGLRAPDSGAPESEAAQLSLVLSKGLLAMADWLRPDGTEFISGYIPMSKLQMELERGRAEWWCDEKAALAMLAAAVSPRMAKAHLRVADYAFEAAQKPLLRFDEREGIMRQMEMTGLTRSESTALLKALASSATLDALEKNVREASAGLPIQSIDKLLGGPGACTSLWAEQRRRQTAMLMHTLSAYFAFLVNTGRASVGGDDSSAKQSSSSVGVVSATLRILHIIARHAQHAAALEHVIAAGMQATDETLWMDILPQVMARLSHPAKTVRQMLVALLARIGRAAPHVICYQVIVGSQSRAVLNEQLLDVDDESGGGGDPGDPGAAISQSNERAAVFECCRQLESSLSEHSPLLVNDVRLFVTLLQSLNLSDERWAFVLTHLDSDMARRMRHLQAETERTMAASHLNSETRADIIHQKTQLIIEPIYRILDDLLARTEEEARREEAEDARRFLALHGEEIHSAFRVSRGMATASEEADNAVLEAEEPLYWPMQRWAPFKKLCATLVQRTARRGGQSVDLATIAPQLVERLAGWAVPLPGQEAVPLSQIVTLHSVHKHALVLATKTRPKKLVFTASDGKTQIFLFKGHEDLHLDERTMQLLQVCNLVLASRSKREWPAYTARHYAVTPLGTLSGLIQWVGGATPLYHIYRRWQQREAQQKTGNKGSSGGNDSSAFRPIELFHHKLKRQFETHKVDARVMGTRREWPVEMLREVLSQLCQETPKDLISREIWLRSSSPSAWWRLTKRFARSVAVMSMMGALLGLGDRHLDNLLLDFDDASLVHIDYNVCFDKGKSLKVPETVPFRLTQNIVHALGATQTEGVFRESCYTVLREVRQHTPLLASLLEAFVYDPLVDWTAARDHLATAVAGTISLVVYGNDCGKREGAGGAGGDSGSAPTAQRMFLLRMRESKDIWLHHVSRVPSEISSWRLSIAAAVASTTWKDNLALLPTLSFDSSLITINRIFNDLHPLLKTMATGEEDCAHLLQEYKRKLNEPLKMVLSTLHEARKSGGAEKEKSEEKDFSETLPLLDKIEPVVRQLSDSLLRLERKILAREKAATAPIGTAISSDTPATPQADPSTMLPPGFEGSSVATKEEQNPLGAAMARRMIAKVEGRLDSVDSERRLSPEEQADALIAQATNQSALALMYEGWTAWV